MNVSYREERYAVDSPKLVGSIAVFDDVLPRQYCADLTRKFDHAEKLGQTDSGRVTTTHGEIETNLEVLRCVDLIPSHLDDGEWREIVSDMHDTYIAPKLLSYTSRFPFLKPAIGVHKQSAIISRYPKGVGEFVTHKDASGVVGYDRDITIVCYLNSVRDGGSTDFPFAGLRVAPIAGRVLLFPSDWLYTHRGTVPNSDDKYILVSFASVSINQEFRME